MTTEADITRVIGEINVLWGEYNTAYQAKDYTKAGAILGKITRKHGELDDLRKQLAADQSRKQLEAALAADRERVERRRLRLLQLTLRQSGPGHDMGMAM